MPVSNPVRKTMLIEKDVLDKLIAIQGKMQKQSTKNVSLGKVADGVFRKGLKA